METENGENGSETARNSLVRCERCHRAIEFGEKAFEFEEGFIGPRGFVPLERTMLFCSEQCLREFLPDEQDANVERIPRRIP